MLRETINRETESIGEIMNIGKEIYPRYADARAPKSRVVSNCVRAFLCGGAICAVAEGLRHLYQFWGLIEEDAGTLTSITLVFVAVLLTGLGIFDRIAKYAGAGTLVPITGFANAVSSPALDFKTEGLVTGLGAKMFVIAGPVIVYGISASIIYGILYYLGTTFFG